MDNTELSFIDFYYTLFFLTIQSAVFDVCYFLSFQTSTLFATSETLLLLNCCLPSEYIIYIF